MTDEQRALAEYVARWAGWESRRYSPYHEGLVWTRDPGNPNAWGDVEPEQTLTDDALAFRALVELAKDERDPEIARYQHPVSGESGFWVCEIAWFDEDREFNGPTPHEAIFRAHRAVRESGGE